MSSHFLIFSFSHYLIFSLSLSFYSQIKAGFSPLYVAAQNGHEQAVQILLKGGAYVDLPSEV